MLSFDWRVPLYDDPIERCDEQTNVILSLCKDGLIRIWSETSFAEPFDMYLIASLQLTIPSKWTFPIQGDCGNGRADSIKQIIRDTPVPIKSASWIRRLDITRSYLDEKTKSLRGWSIDEEKSNPFVHWVPLCSAKVRIRIFF